MTLDEARRTFPAIWTIYDSPADYPQQIVLRVWYGEVPDPRPYPCLSLTHARELAQEQGACVKLMRDASDAPCIVESWI